MGQVKTSSTKKKILNKKERVRKQMVLFARLNQKG